MGRQRDIFEQIRSIESWQAREHAAVARAASWTPQQASDAAAIARMFPAIRPGVVTALIRSGARPTDSVTLRAGLESTKTDLDRPTDYGAMVRAGRLSPGRARTEAAEARRAPAGSTGPDDLDVSYQEYNRARNMVQDRRDSPDPIERAEARGIIKDDVLHRPVDRQFDRESGGYTFASQSDEDDWELFNQVARMAADAQGSDDPVPFVDADDRPALFYPKTGQTSRVGTGDGVAAVDLPGPFDEMLNRTRASIADLMENRRLPTIAPDAAQSVAGPSSGREYVQAGMAALNAPVQEVQGLARAAISWQAPSFQSDFAVMLANPDAPRGNGYFIDPESQVADLRRRREAGYGQIGGHNITAGRWLADSVLQLDPDTRPYQVFSGLVDASVQVFADPSALALRSAGRSAEAARLFAAPDDAMQQAGVFSRALRPVFRPVSGRAWLNTDRGQRTLDWLAETGDSYEIWRRMNRRVSPEFAQRLADAPDATAVRSILEPELGTSIPRVSTAAVTPAIGPMQALDVSRIRGQLPTRVIRDAWNQKEVAFEIEMQLRNANAPQEVISEAFAQAARAKGDPIKLNRAVHDTLSRVDGLLDTAGVKDPGLRRELTRQYENTHTAAQRSFDDLVGANTPNHTGVLVNGRQVTGVDTHLYVELAPRVLPMPDPRPIKRLTQDYPNIFGSHGRAFVNAKGEARLPLAALEFFNNEIWKPLALMRVAWPVRVIAEEQLRMAAAGYDSMFNHPARYIGWRIGNQDTSFERFMARVGVTPRGGGVDGDTAAMLTASDEHQNAMASAHGGWVDRPNQVRLGQTTYQRNIDERERFVNAWHSNMATTAADPVVGHLLNGNGIDETVEWFTRGAGNKFRGGLATAHPGEYDTVAQARGYVEMLQRRVDYLTGGSDELIDALRTGQLGDESFFAGARLNPKFRGRLDGYFDTHAPESVYGDQVVSVRGHGQGPKLVQEWDRFVDWAFGHLMTQRTNNLSRSPVFHQHYWRESERLVGFGTEETKAEIIAAARAANVPNRAIKRMESTRPTGALTTAEVDLLAKGQALDTTKDLLYDLSRRGQFMDAARIIFPFGEAWQEVMTRWFGIKEGLIAKNPAVLQRFQQAMYGARGEEFGDVMGAPEGKGFFWTDEFGQEVFLYPGSRLLTSKLLGVPVPLSGRVQGLSMFGTIIPGLGPVAQVPTAWIIANKPGPEWLKQAIHDISQAETPLGTVEEQLVPFGAPGVEDQSELLSTWSWLPPYMREALDWVSDGDFSEATYANSVLDVAAYLDSTGDYGTSRAERNRLMDDAAGKGRWLSLLVAVGKFAAPAAPGRQVEIDTNEGLIRLRALAEEFGKLRDDDYDTAIDLFVERFGEDALSATIGHTVGIEYGVPTTADGAQWALMHPEVRDGLPHTYGFFAPQGGGFDMRAYDAQFAAGQRVRMTRDQWKDISNQLKGNLIYQAQRDKVGDSPTETQRRWLGEWREWINEEYPGWAVSRSEMSSLPGRPKPEALIREAYDALDFDAVRNTDAGRGLRLYLEHRDRAIAQQEERGIHRSDGLVSDAERMASTRAWLREVGLWVIDQHPEFEPMWEIVFSRETEVDDTETGTVPTARTDEDEEDDDGS